VSYPVSLEDLMLRSRQRANLEEDGASEPPFIYDTELIGHINTSLATWWDLVRGSTFNGTQFRKRANFTTTVADNSVTYSPPPGSFYPLPKDFLSLYSVDVSGPGGLALTARAFQEEQRNAFKFYPFGAWTLGTPVLYQLQGPNIVFIPAPLGEYQVQLNYCPTAPQLTRPDQCFDSINALDEFIVLDVAIKLLTKDGQTDIIPLLAAERDREEKRIKAMVPKRDQNQSEMVHEYGSPLDYYDFWS